MNDRRTLPGLPADDRAFIPIDQHARVQGLSGVYAAGDGTNFPIKRQVLDRRARGADAAAPRPTAEHGIEVEVSLGTDWHRQPMALDPDSPLPE